MHKVYVILNFAVNYICIFLLSRGAGRWIIGGGPIFTDCKNNRLQKKLIVQITNI